MIFWIFILALAMGSNAALPASVPASAKPDEGMWIERFDNPKDKTLADFGWEGGNLDDGKVDFKLMTEGGRTFVRSSYIVGTEAKYLMKKFEWDADTYPWIRWKWRARKLPPNGKVLDSKRSDAGAQVYVLWRYFPRYYVLKYFWGTNDVVGQTLKQGNPIVGSLFGEILQNGPPLNQWKTETRNLREDFLRAFNQKPPGNVRGIAVLSDGDETQGESEADFTEFQVFKQKPQ